MKNPQALQIIEQVRLEATLKGKDGDVHREAVQLIAQIINVELPALIQQVEELTAKIATHEKAVTALQMEVEYYKKPSTPAPAELARLGS